MIRPNVVRQHHILAPDITLLQLILRIYPIDIPIFLLNLIQVLIQIFECKIIILRCFMHSRYIIALKVECGRHHFLKCTIIVPKTESCIVGRNRL